jgi:hypothetical protein
MEHVIASDTLARQRKRARQLVHTLIDRTNELHNNQLGQRAGAGQLEQCRARCVDPRRTVFCWRADASDVVQDVVVGKRSRKFCGSCRPQVEPRNRDPFDRIQHCTVVSNQPRSFRFASIDDRENPQFRTIEAHAARFRKFIPGQDLPCHCELLAQEALSVKRLFPWNLEQFL